MGGLLLSASFPDALCRVPAGVDAVMDDVSVLDGEVVIVLDLKVVHIRASASLDAGYSNFANTFLLICTC